MQTAISQKIFSGTQHLVQRLRQINIQFTTNPSEKKVIYRSDSCSFGLISSKPKMSESNPIAANTQNIFFFSAFKASSVTVKNEIKTNLAVRD